MVAVVAIASAGSLSAQVVRFGIGGGVVMPMGNYHKVDKMGFLVGAHATFWLMGAPVGIRVEGQYSQTSHKNGVDGNSRITGGFGEIVHAFGTDHNRFRLYVLGGIGLFHVKYTIPSLGIDTAVTKVGLGLGSGLTFKLGAGGTQIFVEGKFVSVSTGGGSNTTFLPVRAGLQFGK